MHLSNAEEDHEQSRLLAGYIRTHRPDEAEAEQKRVEVKTGSELASAVLEAKAHFEVLQSWLEIIDQKQKQVY